VPAEGDWAGQPCLVLGGGPSLKRFLPDLARLEGRAKVIAVNRALELPLRADLWLFGDAWVLKWAERGQLSKLRAAIDGYDGPIVTRSWEDREYDGRICAMKAEGPGILGVNGHGCPNFGRNTGFWGLNWAYWLGADPIVLLGFDCKGRRHMQAWWHGGYGYRPRAYDGNYAQWAADFGFAAERLRAESRTVYNASPGTALDCWPVLETMDEILELCDGRQGSDDVG
jgi:hypothetical protein